MALNERITDWHGRRVWLVGASTGIGAALARKLSANGARLALSARSRDKLETLAASCPDSLAMPLDVTVPGSLQQAHDELTAAWGGVDLVVFNAGTYRPLHVEALTPESARETVDLNLLAVMDGVSAVAPTLLRQGKGGVVIVGSVAGYAGLPKALVYGASKAALINFAESLYLDLAPRGISVYLVSPGFVATPLTSQNDFHMPALMQPEDAAEAIVAGLAQGRFEIHFPRRFTLWLKLLRLLPYSWFFPLVRRATGGGR
jgi:short-subunit dehydrogenase